MTGVGGESKGVALTNWLVTKAAGVLERKSSRRGFIMGSAMVGSAVAVAGCAPGTQPGAPYTHITDCAGGLCTDGYTEFCCTILDGLNVCPYGSFAGGWWRADYSSFCNGTRYYIDCMQDCCGPDLGNGFCAGCSECRCAGGCDTRRVYCNYFRYGQCHQEISRSGPIACRVVTCTPPYLDASMACSTVLAVDNSTAEHAPAHGCAPPPPPQLPVTAGAASEGQGKVAVFYRGPDGNVNVFLSSGGGFEGGPIGPAVTSALTAAADGTGLYVFGRGFGDALWWNRRTGVDWSGPQAFGEVPLTSDPVAVTSPDGIYVFALSTGGHAFYGRLVSGAWTGWTALQGSFSSDLAAVSSSAGVHVFGRGTDGQIWAGRLNGTAWTPWSPLGGAPLEAPAAAATLSGVYMFIRNSDNAIWCRRFNGTWGEWQGLGGSFTGVPSAAADVFGNLYVVGRNTSGNIHANQTSGGSWTGWQNLFGNTNASPIAVSASSYVSVFVRGFGDGLWHGKFSFGWSGFQPLGGTVSATDALYA